MNRHSSNSQGDDYSLDEIIDIVNQFHSNPPLNNRLPPIDSHPTRHKMAELNPLKLRPDSNPSIPSTNCIRAKSPSQSQNIYRPKTLVFKPWSGKAIASLKHIPSDGD